MSKDQRVDRLIEALLLLIKKMDSKPSLNEDKLAKALQSAIKSKHRNRTFGSNY